MKKTPKTAHASKTFKTIPIEMVPRQRAHLDTAEIERALEVAQDNPKKAVIAFSGTVEAADKFRIGAWRFLGVTKRQKFYHCTRRKGQVFIWRLLA